MSIESPHSRRKNATTGTAWPAHTASVLKSWARGVRDRGVGGLSATDDGIPVAMSVMNRAFAARRRPAVETTAFATRSGAIVWSCRRVPSGCREVGYDIPTEARLRSG